MRRAAIIGSLIFFVFGPVLEAGVGPWVLTGGFSAGGEWPVVLRVVGALLIVGGLLVIVRCFAGFALDGLGTPSPMAPPRELVVSGAYRFVRNPMYVATAAVIVGEGLLLRRVVLLVGAALYVAALAVLHEVVEQPMLRRRFGAAYDAYADAVPAWIPRLRPWHG